MSKFDSELTEKAYELSLDTSYIEEQFGAVDEGSWNAWMKLDPKAFDGAKAVWLSEDSQGFVNGSFFTMDAGYGYVAFKEAMQAHEMMWAGG